MARAQDVAVSPASINSYQPGAAADDSYDGAADVADEAPMSSPPPAGVLGAEAAELLHAPPSPDAMSAISGATGASAPLLILAAVFDDFD